MSGVLPKAGALGLAFLLSSLCAASAAQRVPFVGCPADGQGGPVAAPRGAPKAVNLDPASASQLAYYQAQDSLGVLAPRGWTCFFLSGSSGASLIVAPGGKLDDFDLRLAGPAVTLTLDLGSTSGRFDVAKYSARLFAGPARAFIAGVIAEGVEPKENFVFAPYPADRLIPRSPTLVEYETPANADGLGASGRLQKSGLPILGMARLKSEPDGPDFLLLAVRLPAAQARLAAAIVHAAE